MQYHLFLFDSDDRIGAAEAYRAVGDSEAVEIGGVVQSAVSDQFERFEVWRGSELVRNAKWRNGLTVDELIDRHEEAVLEIMERLHRTFAAIKRSRNLIETMDRLLERRWSLTCFAAG